MTASTLHAQQHAMLQAVTGADAAAAGAWLRKRRDGRPALLSVYRNAYIARLAAALADNYLVLQCAMGDESFHELALAFIRACPSRHPSIRWFGELLPDFMAQRDDLVGHPALVDLARMDWALREAFDAADAPALAPQDLARLPPEGWPGLRLQLHPSAQRLALQWNVEPAWRVLREHDPESGAAEPELPEPQAHPHHLLVWRQGLETRWRSLPPREAAWLAAVQAGRSFGELCERALQDEADESAAALAVVQALQQWLGEGLVSGWSTG